MEMKRKTSSARFDKVRFEQGFSLLEVMVAMVIVLVGLLSVVQMFTLGMLYNRSAKQTTMATALVQRKMERLLSAPLTDSELQIGVGPGTFNKPTTVIQRDTYKELFLYDPATKRFNKVTEGQPFTYQVTWKIEPDTITGVDNLPNLLRITVRAEASVSALQGNGVGASNTSSLQPEFAEITTIRTPSI
jgi:prepilin-type N-terminal cleavage/methylation domain-containing protein